jgi:hypothetical protein
MYLIYFETKAKLNRPKKGHPLQHVQGISQEVTKQSREHCTYCTCVHSCKPLHAYTLI